ncbi:MAG TPA: SHOCT domain-containing protein [Pseudogracilibacillus sp.]|nr:SHOCT domain-containing protein [Pseudogracilibacillus sp.]
MHMPHGYGAMWSTPWMLIFWVILIGLGIYLITNFIHNGKKQTPLQILQKRLAKGEIDEAEYERLKAIIEKDEKK